MRIAILSDIHGNLTALEAVIKDLHQASLRRPRHLDCHLRNGNGNLHQAGRREDRMDAWAPARSCGGVH